MTNKKQSLGVKIQLASPEKVRSWSYGEVKKTELMTIKTMLPALEGLHCCRIFGPVENWRCMCTKFAGQENQSEVCDRCGVEVAPSYVRKERFGHIELVKPCTHPWYVKSRPNIIAALLGVPAKKLKEVIYNQSYIVIDPGNTWLNKKEIIERERHIKLLAEMPNSFISKTGSEAIKELLEEIDLEELFLNVYKEIRESISLSKIKKLSRRLQIIDSFRKSGNRPEWMILDALPVIPADLRPITIQGRKIAVAGLNFLYLKVLSCNKRLKQLITRKAPESILLHAQNRLQKAIDTLFGADKDRLSQSSALSQKISGKKGSLYQSIDGKIVNYSAIAPLAVDPTLQLNQCALPRELALDLYKPFVCNELLAQKYVTTPNDAEKLFSKKTNEVWGCLSTVVADFNVFLSYKPVRQHFSLMGFQAKLTTGNAIKVNPYIIGAFNSSLEGELVTVHLPLSNKAQEEIEKLMLPSNNLLNPSNGLPVFSPSKDLVLGCYYLTQQPSKTTKVEKYFSSPQEVLLALDAGVVKIQTPIGLYYKGTLIDLEQAFNDQNLLRINTKEVHQVIKTTVGRVIFNQSLPAKLPFINGTIKDKGLQDLVKLCYLQLGAKKTIELLERLKTISLEYVTKAGFSLGLDDFASHPDKKTLIQKAIKEVEKIDKAYIAGNVTTGERLNRIFQVWSETSYTLAKKAFETVRYSESDSGKQTPLLSVADSEARVLSGYIPYLMGMKGLITTPSRGLLELPIISNFGEGLNSVEYLMSTFGMHRNLSNSNFKAADARSLMRRLIVAAQDVVISQEDCGTSEGFFKETLAEGGEIINSLSERVLGRVTVEDILDPLTCNTLVKAGEEITEQTVKLIESAPIRRIKIRSPLTCESNRGICAKCYGRDLVTNCQVQVGKAVGVIAGQAIGAYSDKLPMRTFHICLCGCAPLRFLTQSSYETPRAGKIYFAGVETAFNRDAKQIVVNQGGSLVLKDEKGNIIENFPAHYAAEVLVYDGAEVKQEESIMIWDPFTFSFIASKAGKVCLVHISPEENLKEEINEITGDIYQIITDSDKPLVPRVRVCDGETVVQEHMLAARNILLVVDGQEVLAGDVLAKVSRELTRAKDISGGLPRINELFEAIKPSEAAILTEISGRVKFCLVKESERIIQVIDKEGNKREYIIPRGTHVNVQHDDYVKAGETLIDGPYDPKDLLRVLGLNYLRRYLIDELQECYKLDGIEINDKHFEIIVRQMLRFVIINYLDYGDENFLPGQETEIEDFIEKNNPTLNSGLQTRYERLLIGITKSVLKSKGFLSISAFQNAVSVLTKAAIAGQMDNLESKLSKFILGG